MVRSELRDRSDVTKNMKRAFRIGVSAVLAVYGVVIGRTPDAWSALDFVNLPIHETGHLVFAPFGETLTMLGGTLLQIAMPLLFAASFLRRRDEHAASVCIWWAGQSAINVGRYMADAIPMELPLVGGGEHDWNILFSQWDVLRQSMHYAHVTTISGMVVMLGAAGWGMLVALRAPTERRVLPAPAP